MMLISFFLFTLWQLENEFLSIMQIEVVKWELPFIYTYYTSIGLANVYAEL